jgi:hypothetical protein
MATHLRGQLGRRAGRLTSPIHRASASSGRAIHFFRCVASGPFDKKNWTERSVAPLRDQGLVRTGQFDDLADRPRNRDQPQEPAA